MKKIYYAFLFLLLTPFSTFAFGSELYPGLSENGIPPEPGMLSVSIDIFWIIVRWVSLIGAVLGIAGIIFGLGLYIAQAFSKDKNKKIFKNKKRIVKWSLLLCVTFLLIIFFLITITSDRPYASESF